MSDELVPVEQVDLDCLIRVTTAWVSGTPRSEMLDIVAVHRLAERERCAKAAEGEVVDAEVSDDRAADEAYNLACSHIAAAIRNMGKGE